MRIKSTWRLVGPWRSETSLLRKVRESKQKALSKNDKILDFLVSAKKEFQYSTYFLSQLCYKKYTPKPKLGKEK